MCRPRYFGHMSKKIEIDGDLYDEDAIAFVRKLKKKSEGKHYAVVLKTPYSLDGKGRVYTIFLNQEDGERVMRELKSGPEGPH